MCCGSPGAFARKLLCRGSRAYTVRMRQRSHYEVLQVREDASPEVILAAWRALDRQFDGPEVRSIDADHLAGQPVDQPLEQALREQVARAAAVLLDPMERARYDAGQAAGRERDWTGSAVVSGKAGWGESAGASRVPPGASPLSGSSGVGWAGEASRPGVTPYRRSTLVLLGLAWLGFFGILFLGFDHYLEIRENPNRNLTVMAVEQEQIFLRRNRSGHYVVPGKINGHPVSFLIDTGATQVSIPAELADNLQLRAGARSRALTANGPVEVRQTRVALLHIGPFEFRNVSAHLNPGMTGNQVLLGMSVLSHLDFEQSNNRLALRMP